MQASRIVATPAAQALLDELKAKHGNLMFHQSGGCCEGSAPMCMKKGEFLVGAADVKLGEVHGVPFYMAKFQFEYWEHTHLTLDAIPVMAVSFRWNRAPVAISSSAPACLPTRN